MKIYVSGPISGNEREVECFDSAVELFLAKDGALYTKNIKTFL
jgi:hypothetical protein